MMRKTVGTKGAAVIHAIHGDYITWCITAANAEAQEP